MEKGKEYKQKHETLKKQQEIKAVEGLTFKPKINPQSTKNAIKNGPIWQRLHNQAERFHEKKVDADLDEIMWNKAPHEYKFKPEILGDKRKGK